MYPRIRDLREDRDLTQTQVAKMLSMSQTGYSKYETGENDIPTAISDPAGALLRHQRGLPARRNRGAAPLPEAAARGGVSADPQPGMSLSQKAVPQKKKTSGFRPEIFFLCGTAPCRAGHVLSAACVRAVHVRRITAFRSAGTR